MRLSAPSDGAAIGQCANHAPDARLKKDVDATPGSLGARLMETASTSGWNVEITSPEGA